VAEGQLEEVFEVESLKEWTRFTKADVQDAECEWRQSLLRQLDASDVSARAAALERLEGTVCDLARSWDSCALAKRAFEAARPGQQQERLAWELRGQVCKLIVSAPGCEVLETCLEQLRPSACFFIAEELVGHATNVAFRINSYQVLCRIFEFLPLTETWPLVEELLGHVFQLSCHEFGSVVVQTILEHGSSVHRNDVCMAVLHNISYLANDSIASDVVEMAASSRCTAGKALRSWMDSMNRLNEMLITL
jgi:hypothetical protein